MMTVCLATADSGPDVMLCRTTGTSCSVGDRLTIWHCSTYCQVGRNTARKKIIASRTHQDSMASG